MVSESWPLAGVVESPALQAATELTPPRSEARSAARASRLLELRGATGSGERAFMRGTLSVMLVTDKEVSTRDAVVSARVFDFA